MKKFILALPAGIASIVITALVMFLSLDSDPFDVNELKLFDGADKLCHVIMYFCVTAVYIFDYAKFKLPHHTNTNVELALAALASLLGLFMEIAQLVMSNGRNYEANDIVADIVGAVIAFLLIKFWLMHKFRKYLLYSRRHHHHHHKNGGSVSARAEKSADTTDSETKE